VAALHFHAAPALPDRGDPGLWDTVLGEADAAFCHRCDSPLREATAPWAQTGLVEHEALRRIGDLLKNRHRIDNEIAVMLPGGQCRPATWRVDGYRNLRHRTREVSEINLPRAPRRASYCLSLPRRGAITACSAIRREDRSGPLCRIPSRAVTFVMPSPSDTDDGPFTSLYERCSIAPSRVLELHFPTVRRISLRDRLNVACELYVHKYLIYGVSSRGADSGTVGFTATSDSL